MSVAGFVDPSGGNKFISMRKAERVMFIDRQKYLQIFQSLLQPASENWLLILHGLSGVGKSTLLQELSAHHLPRAGHTPINFDETIFCLQPFELIRTLETGLGDCDLPEQAWEKYRTQSRKIDRWIHNQQIKVTQIVQASSGGQISNVNQHAALNVDRQAWERQIVVSAARDQMQALLELCQGYEGSFVIFLDHWDSLVKTAAPDYKEWVVQGVLRKLQKQLGSLRAVIAADRPLEEAALDRGVIQIELQPFAAQDAALLMSTIGLNDPKIQAAVFEWTAGNPLLIQLAVELWKLEPMLDLEDLAEGWSVKAASEWLLQRIIERLPDDRSRKVLERGVILRKWTLNDLAHVFSPEDLDLHWYNEFTTYPFVEHLTRPPGYKAFVRTVREIQIAQLWQNKTDDYHETHSYAYRWYKGQPK
jgi:hypothetical protein